MILTIIGVVLIAIGLLGLFSLVHIGIPVSVALCIIGLLCVVFNSGMGALNRRV